MVNDCGCGSRCGPRVLINAGGYVGNEAAERAKRWAQSAESPDGREDEDSTTGKTQSAKGWALQAKKEAASVVGKYIQAATNEQIDKIFEP